MRRKVSRVHDEGSLELRSYCVLRLCKDTAGIANKYLLSARSEPLGCRGIKAKYRDTALEAAERRGT